MRLRFSVALLLATCAPAQDLAAEASELTHLRAAVQAMSPAAPMIVIAIVDGGDPVVLCSGDDTAGKPVDPMTYMPVGALARLLIADALHVQLNGKLDIVAGVKVGAAEPTFRALLQGTKALPDYWDWRGDATPLSVATLQACADVAAEAHFEFSCERRGVAELVLLADRILNGTALNGRDWQSWLRVNLAPRVGGFDPHDAALLAEQKTPVAAASTVAQRANPAALRLMVTGKDLANWWQWRLRTPMPEWSGARMGYSGGVHRRDGISVWRFEDTGTTPVKCQVHSYPGQRSGLLCISTGAVTSLPARDEDLATTFEADLFGPLPNQAIALFGGRVRPGAPPLKAWQDRRWSSGGDAKTPCKIWIEDTSHKGLRFEFGGKVANSSQVGRGEAMRVVVAFDKQRRGILWLHPRPGVNDPQRLVGVFVEHDEMSCIPHRVELALEEAPR